MTRLIRRVPIGQILPRCTGTQDPQDAVQDIPRGTRRPTASILAGLVAEERFEQTPLLVGEIHADGTTVGRRL
jgi:hypothetical protein